MSLTPTDQNSDKILFTAFNSCYILFSPVMNPYKGKNKGKEKTVTNYNTI